MAETLTPDICVIGAGSGGLSVAAAAAAFGVPVVLIEKSKMGGDCLNYGCVPSKALLAAAGEAARLAKAGAFGVAYRSAEIDFAKVHDHVRATIAAIAPNDSKERFAGLGVRVLTGTARFTDRRTVAVGDEFLVRARRFVIATGSVPAIPEIPGLAQVPHLTNETIFDLTDRPRHLIILGAGPVGIELAQAFRRLGAAVTVIEQGSPLGHDDPECTAVVLDQLVREGVSLRSHTTIAEIGRSADGLRLVIEHADGRDTISGSHLLVATGRRPNTADLALDVAGIQRAGDAVRIDRYLRTTNRRVYAVGDVTGGPQFTHAANYHAGLAIRNAVFRIRAANDPNAIPRVTFTDPELAHVGLTENEATRIGYTIRVLRSAYHDNDRAIAERSTRGHIKVVTTRRGKILGATIVGAHAGELITTWALAIQQALNIRLVASLVVPYPTLSEVGKRAALGYFAPSLTSTTLRRIIAWLRRLG